MMKIVHFFQSRIRRESRWFDLANRIVDRSFERTWQRVSGRILELSPAEGRGYVRARTGGLLREAAIAECGEGGARRVDDLVMNATMQRVFERVHVLRDRFRRAA